MAADIVNSIIDAMIDPDEGFMASMNAGVITTDPLRLKTFQRGPLQDDPTTRALYLCVMPDVSADDPNDFSRMPVDSIRRGKLGTGQTDLVPQHEIGGGLRFINFFVIEGWAPQSTSREAVYERGNLFLRRAELALFKMQRVQFFAGIRTDDEMESTADMQQVFGYDGGRCSPVGGESEWYGKIRMRFHIYSEISNRIFADMGI